MTIHNTKLSRKLELLEMCAEHAPEGTYEQAKRVREIIGDACDAFMHQLREMNLKAPNCDPIRDVEAVLWGYVRRANPNLAALAEGFGEAMEGPARDRVIAQAERDRDALAIMTATGGVATSTISPKS